MITIWDAKNNILIGMGLAVVYSLAYIYLMSCFGETISWILIGVIQIGLILGSIFSFYAWKNSSLFFESDDTNSPKIAMAAGIVLGLFAAIFLCMLCYGFRSLKIAIDVIDASADFLAKTKRIIIVPIIFFILTILIVFVWFLAVMSVLSVGEITADNSKI
jgi:hypothetical protein